MSETEMSKSKSSLFGDAGDLLKTGVSLLAGITGGPGGYAAAQTLFSLGEGSSFGDALQQGIGGFLGASTLGPVGASLMGNNSFGGSGSNPESMGLGAFMQSMGTEKGQKNVLNNVLMASLAGGPQSGIQAAMTTALNPGFSVNPKAAMLELMKKQNAVRWDETMTGEQQGQFDTGERRPDYTGTVLPGTPRVQTRAMGGMIDGPGTGTSDSIPAQIYQNGGPVQEARLSDGEFVMTADAVRGAGGGDRDAGAAKMYRMMNQLEGVA